ncbi:hypothetical protein MUY_001503 [Bacillus licheniformis WX-02]|nr:hypothetical protein MUY_001503 [Bacillus licheniformis WX-02]
MTVTIEKLEMNTAFSPLRIPIKLAIINE